jgi:glycosyltransferase involved in cell wall biosynthesis
VNLFFSLHMVVPGPKKDIYHRLEYGKVRKIFALGEEGMLSARKNLPITPDRVMELPYGLETDRYRPGRSEKLRESLGLGPEKIVLGVLSRLDPLKGQMEAVRAMPMILDKYPNAHLLMAGDETVHLRGVEKKRIEAEIGRRGLKDKVTILPYQRDVPELLRGIDLFLLPSHYESYSISLIEAKLCGVPVVAAESGGVRQNLGYGEFGILVKPKDPASLASGVIKTLDDMDAAKKRAEKARENALKRYDKERIVSIVESEYLAACRGELDMAAHLLL